jgi:hypothetical protein
MHNAALALHVGNESCCGLFALALFDVVFVSARRSLRADIGAVIVTGLAVQAGSERPKLPAELAKANPDRTHRPLSNATATSGRMLHRDIF